MTDIAKNFMTHAMSKSAITDLVGDRMYQGEDLPQGLTLPAIMFHVIDSPPQHELSGGDANSAETRIQVNFYAATDTALSLANAFRKAGGFQGFHGDMDGTWVDTIECRDAQSFRSDAPTDGSDQRRYIVSQDYQILHEDT